MLTSGLIKIYREDELEQELERLKEKLARNERKSAKSSGEANMSRLRAASPTSSLSSDQDVCELCEKPGHDMFNCDGLPPLQPKLTRMADPSDLFCEDCDTHGHTTAECPHSMDVF